MKEEITLGSLFDGSGGFPLGRLLAGIKPVWNSESRVLSEHIIQSFNRQEVTPEQALEIGKELCRRFLKSQYQYVLSQDYFHRLRIAIQLNIIQ